MCKVLVVVDMQNDFIDGSLGTDEARAVVGRVAELIAERRRAGYEIIVTLDTHSPDYLSTQEGIKLPVVHCVKGTRGWQLNEKIAAAAKGCKAYEKDTFGSRDLFRDLARAKPRLVEFVGLCTDICVVSNALGLKAYLPETEIAVHSDCCAGVTPERHLSALETMKACQITVL